MAMAFGRNGTLYAVGDCNPAPTTFECTPGSDPTYNSLYKVDVRTGKFTRIGSTGAPQFFMDLTFDRNGNMLGVTTTLNLPPNPRFSTASIRPQGRQRNSSIWSDLTP